MHPADRALKEYRIEALENAIWGAIHKTYSETGRTDDQEAAQALSLCLARALGVPIEDEDA